MDMLTYCTRPSVRPSIRPRSYQNITLIFRKAWWVTLKHLLNNPPNPWPNRWSFFHTWCPSGKQAHATAQNQKHAKMLHGVWGDHLIFARLYIYIFLQEEKARVERIRTSKREEKRLAEEIQKKERLREFKQKLAIEKDQKLAQLAREKRGRVLTHFKL